MAARAYHALWRERNRAVPTGESRRCEQCGAVFLRYRSMNSWNWRRRRFCSPACAEDGTKAVRAERISRAKQGKAPWHAIRAAHTPEAIAKNAAARRGRHQSEESNRKRSESLRGAKGPNWRGGIYAEHMRVRRSEEYKAWALSVKNRDAWRCVLCGSSGVPVHADHIEPFASRPELRFDIKNGRTLCVPCHHDTDTWGRRATA